MNDKKIMIDEEVTNLSLDRKLFAFQKACRTIGLEYEVLPHTIGVDIDPEDLHEVPGLLEAFTDELKKMVTQDIMDDLVRKGMVEVSFVTEDGDPVYVATELGRTTFEDRLDGFGD